MSTVAGRAKACIAEGRGRRRSLIRGIPDYKLQVASEVLPSPSFERPWLNIRIDQPHPDGSRSASDPSHANSLHFSGHGARGRKQQFVVIAAVQRQIERDL